MQKSTKLPWAVKLQYVLKKKGLTLNWLAQELGVSRQYLDQMARGQKTLSLEREMQIGKLAGVDPLSLFTEQKERK